MRIQLTEYSINYENYERIGSFQILSHIESFVAESTVVELDYYVKKPRHFFQKKKEYVKQISLRSPDEIYAFLKTGEQLFYVDCILAVGFIDDAVFDKLVESNEYILLGGYDLHGKIPCADPILDEVLPRFIFDSMQRHMTYMLILHDASLVYCVHMADEDPGTR